MKKKVFLTALAGLIVLSCITSCKKTKSQTDPNEPISQTTLNAIEKMGFSTNAIIRKNDGFIVEGDIFIANKDIGKMADNAPPAIVIAKTEQYKAWQTVLGLPRTITVYCGMGGVYSVAVDSAIARYNNLSLNLTFQRVSGSGDVTIYGEDDQYDDFLGYTPYFPDNNGNPGSSVVINTNVNELPSTSPLSYVTSVVQHELGHVIGLRHSDWFNRFYSCGYRANTSSNEDYDNSYNYLGEGPGHILIPGTPSSEDAGSFMLACQPAGTTGRTFNANDIIALNYLYGGTVRIPRTIKSTYFSNVYMRTNGAYVDSYITNGGGTVNCQYGFTSFERYYITPQTDGTYTIESYAWPNVFLRLDANGLGYGSAGGTVNTQFTPPGAYEKYYITKQTDGSYTIQSAYFSGRYLRMAGSGVTYFMGNGGGAVNVTYNSPGAYEKFTIYPDLY